jgi:methylmalonyl-CoA/ethylmalonyl-CoA epimerase
MRALDHVAIAVKNLDEAISLYRTMGFHVSSVETVEEQKVRVAMLELENTHIELLEPTSEDSPISRFLEKRGEGLHHIAVRVDDIEETLASLKEKGIRLIDGVPRTGAGGKRIAFVHPKSAKVLLELVEA